MNEEVKVHAVDSFYIFKEKRNNALLFDYFPCSCGCGIL